MSLHAMFAVVMVASAALAVWIDARFPSLLPPQGRIVFLHVIAGTAVLKYVLPAGLIGTLGQGTTAWWLVGILGIAVPAFVYKFLGYVWVVRFVQGWASNHRL